MAKKYVYSFGGGKGEGNESMKNLLGGKGANLAEMAGNKDLMLPVPPGFTCTTEVCTYYYQNKKKYPKELKAQVLTALAKVEKLMDRKFGDVNNPLLFSVRSGARKSMPGMMETVLNVGLTEKTIPGLIRQSGGNDRFVYDAYRRLIMMYSDVVMEKAAGIEPKGEEGIRKQLEKIMAEMKKAKNYKIDTDLNVGDLKNLCAQFKVKIKEVLGKEFPDEPMEQLWGGIGAVFSSWNGKRAISYRRIENIPDEWGTAVNVQTMVFGNMGDDSATGVAFTRNPGNGENNFYGEYLINAQGEDVVAGIRTPAPINEYSTSSHNKNLLTLEKAMPRIYKELYAIQNRLEKHYHDMQDIEFTIEKGRLFMLQCRVGKRNGPAAVRMAVDMVKEKMIKKEQAVMRVTPAQLDELLHPIIDPKTEITVKPFAKGLPAGPGGACGQIVFSSHDAVEWAKTGKKVILVREETNPEDVEGMRVAQAILTARGGMTSHAALVARGWGKCCIVGCSAMHVDLDKKLVQVEGTTLKEGDWITLNGTKGNVYEGQLRIEKSALNFIQIHDEKKEFTLRRDILDQQVVDTHNHKVIRVNDIQLLVVDHALMIAHVDIGSRGLLRRLGFEKGIDLIVKLFNSRARYLKNEHLISWKYIQPLTINPVSMTIKIDLPQKNLASIPAADLGDIFLDLNINHQIALFKSLNLANKTKIFTNIDFKTQASLLGEMNDFEIAELLNNIPSDEATDFLEKLPREKTKHILNLIENKYSKRLSQLLGYSGDSAGGLMTTEYIAFAKDTPVEVALNQIRERAFKSEPAQFIYIIDEAQHLISTTNFRRLILANPQEPIQNSAFPKTYFVHLDSSVKEVAYLMEKYKYFAIPVVDESNVLQGIITVDDILSQLIAFAWRRLKRIKIMQKT